ncbi:MAG TPA: hypothetical protein DHV26_06800 [Cytophagales bacterium]|nr:hypothetical protein [Cytophagales bacterium]
MNQPLQNFLADLKNTSPAVVLNGHGLKKLGLENHFRQTERRTKITKSTLKRTAGCATTCVA